MDVFKTDHTVKPPVNNEYIAKINRVIDYIDLNLGKSMTLDELSKVSHFSKFHFNRIFLSIVGESPFQFILRLRLEKSASLLLANDRESISDIAFRCGYSDLSVFSRNFKKYFGISASQYRRDKFQNSNINQVKSKLSKKDERPHLYFCHDSQMIKWKTKMEMVKSVEVKELPSMTVGYLRNMGPYNGDKEQYENHRNRLFSWAASRDLLNTKDFKYLVLYHDNPQVALSDNLRMSLCVTIPEDLEVEGQIGKMHIVSTTYVLCRFELREDEFSLAWDWIYGQWFPNSGYQPDDKPYFETYPIPPKDGLFVVDFCIPVKPL